MLAEVLAANALTIIAGGKPNRRVRALRRREEEWAQKTCDSLPKACFSVNAHGRGDCARVAVVDRHAAMNHAFCKLPRKQNVGQFALSICFRDVVAARQVDIVPMDASHLVRAGSD